MSDRPEWESVAKELQRIRVPGGWLYRTYLYADRDEYGRAGEVVGVALTFVPSPPRGGAS